MVIKLDDSLTERKKIGKNALMLYVLTASNFIFGVVTVPYQTRILGPEYYGLIGLATALTMYIQLVLDFGFMLTATKRVAENSESRFCLSKIFTCVCLSKSFLAILCLCILVVIGIYSEILQENCYLFFLYFLWAVTTSFLPDFVYRGLQDMQLITYRTVAIRALFTILVFLFLNDKNDIIFVPLFNWVGSLGALVWSLLDINYRYGIKICNVAITEIVDMLKQSFMYFVSRIASTVYGATNIIVLNYFFVDGVVLGYYTSAEKVVNLARAGASPIADSIYPYMVKNNDFKLVKKLLKVFMPIIILGALILYVYAVDICMFVFGDLYAETGKVLRYMIPMIIMVLPIYVLGFPTMTPLGLERDANLSVVIGAIIQSLGLVGLCCTNELNIKSICYATCFSEFSVLVYRVVKIYEKIRL